MHAGVRNYFIFQAILSLLIIIIVILVAGKKAGFSAFIASVCYQLPNMLFARQLFLHRGAQSAKKIVKGFYRGEAIKLLSTIGLMGVVFAWVPVTPLPFFITFIVLQMSIWVAPLFIKTSHIKGQEK